MYEIIIIGGSSAGLSAALTLGRSLRRVLVIDDGLPANRFSRASHGFLTQDGTTPQALLAQARLQIAQYPTVEFAQETVLSVQSAPTGFDVVTGSRRIGARKLLLATGLHDELPLITGVREAWGHGVFHCPYCDGYEVNFQPLGVYGTTEHALHQVKMLVQWTNDLTVYTDGVLDLTDVPLVQLMHYGVRFVETPVVAVRSGADGLEAVVLADGEERACRGLFIRPESRQRTTFPADLGCVMDEFGLVAIDTMGRTSVKGVYAAGDLSNPRRSVALAVAQGVSAAHGLNFDLMREIFP